MSLGPVAAFFDAAFTANLTILVDDPQAHNFISVIDKLVYEPFQRKLGVVILVGATQKGAGPFRVAIILMLRP